MKYQFFKNTGVQFFGDSSKEIKLEPNQIPVPDGMNGSSDLSFSSRMFRGEWLPLALDNERNLVRFLYNGKACLFSIDTTIRDNSNGTMYKNSLMKSDISEELKVHEDLISDNSNRYERIKVTSHIDQWVKAIFQNKKKGMKKYYDAYPDSREYSTTVSYKLFVGSLIEQNPDFIPAIKILADHANASDTIDANLYIDLGNSRTIGLFVEKDIATDDYNIKNAAPLKILNYETLMREGSGYLNDYANMHESDFDYLISSTLKFKKNIFSRYPQGESFNLPSIICIGSEADQLAETSEQTPNTGISGPKRYLWSDNQEKQFWKFHGGDDQDNEIEGEILKYIPFDDSDNVLNGIYTAGLTRKPLKAVYPRRSMMIFAMIEIIYQAFTQLNSIHHRKRVGNANVKRDMKNIIISFPTAMPFWERQRLIKQSRKAVLILKKVNAIPYDINIELGSDEATCSQVSFLYGEASRFPGQGKSFFNLISGTRRDSKVRIASLDIGGGTTDLMIADYERSNLAMAQNSDLSQQLVYSDGVNQAGDDILKHLVTKFVIEALKDSVDKLPEGDGNRFIEYFGAGAPEADKKMRVEAMNGLLIPIAEFYMYYMSNSESFSKNELNKDLSLFELSELMQNHNLKKLEITAYFKKHKILPETEDFYKQHPISNLIPDIKELEAEVYRVFQEVLYRFAWVIGEHRPDFLILAGKTTSLPIIGKTLRQFANMPPSKIISLKDYFIGAWHPFSKNGIVNDPKTSVVVGNAISHISINKEMNDVNIVTEGSKSKYSLNYIGANVAGETFDKSMTIFDSANNSNGSSLYLQNKINILCRNIDDQKMPSNLIYQVRLNKDGKRIKVSSEALEVTIDTSDPRKGLTLKSVKGDVVDLDANQTRAADLNDVILKEQTLMDGEYYLDNGIFGVM